ncbi:MAG TPA: methyltransferase domain-containing protein [Vicinamibacterales bacterium]|nr:methyltransferase domain-containing protein [Vicinamibacterales bacterium]
MPLETCFIRRTLLPIPPVAARVAGILDRVELSASDGVLTLQASERGIPVNSGHVSLPQHLLDELDWPAGAVVEVHSGDGGVLRVLKSRDLLSTDYVTYDRGVAVPPGWLMQTVVGSPSAENFIHSSHSIAAMIVDAATPHISDRATWRILDFGCGCGRLSRALPLYHQSEIVGCDLQVSAINWCNQWLDGTFFVGRQSPPLPLPDSEFDLLVAISVLTHLSEEDQDAWLGEWSRVTRPGGILFVTFRSEAYLQLSEPDRLKAVQSGWARTGGIAYSRSDYWVEVFPEYYGSTYHSEKYVRSHWQRYFDVLDIVPARRGSLLQDVAILRARR